MAIKKLWEYSCLALISIWQRAAWDKSEANDRLSPSIISMLPRANYQNEGSAANGSSCKDLDAWRKYPVTADDLPPLAKSLWSGRRVSTFRTVLTRLGVCSKLTEEAGSITRRPTMIKKVKEGYKVLSEKGKNLGGPYKSRAEAEKRLRQVEYFKHRK